MLFDIELPDNCAYSFRRIAKGVYNESPMILDHIEYKTDRPFDNSEELRALMNRDPNEITWIENKATGEVYNKDFTEFWERDKQTPKDYGLCDHWTQIVTRWPELISSERKFIILVRYIEGEEGQGFRMHKNGSYIGWHEGLEDYEYLHDFPDTNELTLFQLVEL